MTYYQIDGKIYYFNLDVVFELVSKVPNNEKIINADCGNVYDLGHDIRPKDHPCVNGQDRPRDESVAKGPSLSGLSRRQVAESCRLREP